LDVLLANAVQHAPGGVVDIEASREEQEVVVTVTDTGRAVGEDLRQDCFTLAGQERLKGRADGRYGRAGGLLAARLIVEAMGGVVEAGGVDGAAVFTVRLRSVKP
ncbi:MAG: ATP-binding protein, partial [Deltaproteobacteria bacterium]|nr:ATP-binding protein [Deltaproteobacteria bacterium]